MSNAKEIREKIRRLEEVPTLPHSFTMILNTIEDEDSTVKDLADIIAKDQALCSKILKMANSAYYGRFRNVATIEQAVIVVGFNEVRSASLTISVYDSFSSVVPAEVLEDFWIHVLTSAAAVRLLGDRGQEIHPEKVYIGALLHDIGKLALHSILGDAYFTVVQEARSRGQADHEAEKEAYQLHHGQVGGWLAERWHFPAELMELIAQHHSPFAASVVRPKGVATVYLANKLAHQATAGEENIWPFDGGSKEAMAVLQLDSEELAEMCGAVRRQQTAIKEVFSLIS
ncbi:MAG: HDOD domain-containing protein [Deltaproteobacteria bacterium]|nr:HDOD domain-containing protein [Deltaproteobacteria bacterium]MBW2069691.1 HDOD domain-containing protein [Deltaproteobacteria bacterium]